MGVRLDVGGLMGALVGVAASSVGVCGLTPVSLPLFSAARRERKEKKTINNTKRRDRSHKMSKKREQNEKTKIK